MEEEKDNPHMSTRIAILETDMVWIKTTLNTIDKRTWSILACVILSVLLAVLNFLR